MRININAAKPVKFNASAVEAALDADGCLLASVKYDSVRCHLVIKPTGDIDGKPAARAYAFSRTNKLIPALRGLFSSDAEQIMLGQLLGESLYPSGLVLDGEIMVKGKDFYEGSGMLRRKGLLHPSELVYVLYGVVPLDHIMNDFGGNSPISVSNVVMMEQLQVIYHQVTELLPSLEWQVAEGHLVYTMEELDNLYETVRLRGLEGLVIKRPFQHWHRGKKVGWWKMKPEDTLDGVVVDVLWGTVGKSNEGRVVGFVVELEQGVTVNVDGLTNDMKDTVTNNVTSNPEFYKGWAVQVKFMEMTPAGSVRHPKFDCWRGTESDPTLKA